MGARLDPSLLINGYGTVVDLPGRITRMRREMGIEQADLAERLRVHTVTVARWEAGMRSPGGDEIYSIVSIYTDWLIAYTSAGEVVLRSDDERWAARRQTAGVLHSVAMSLRARSRVFASVLQLGGRFTLEKHGWQSALGVSDKVLRGLPIARYRSERGGLWGYDVGASLEARLQGTTYRRFVEARGPILAALFGEIRLLQEFDAAWDDVRGAADSCLAVVGPEQLGRVRQKATASVLSRSESPSPTRSAPMTFGIATSGGMKWVPFVAPSPAHEEARRVGHSAVKRKRRT